MFKLSTVDVMCATFSAESTSQGCDRSVCPGQLSLVVMETVLVDDCSKDFYVSLVFSSSPPFLLLLLFLPSLSPSSPPFLLPSSLPPPSFSPSSSFALPLLPSLPPSPLHRSLVPNFLLRQRSMRTKWTSYVSLRPTEETSMPPRALEQPPATWHSSVTSMSVQTSLMS